MSDILMPKGQQSLDRLSRRIDNYRTHHNDCLPRFQHTVNGLNEQQKQDTLVLRQRFLESKSKKTAKKSDKKQDVSNGPQKAQKRACEDLDLASSGAVPGGDSLEPPTKIGTGKSNGSAGSFKMGQSAKRQGNSNMHNESLKKYSMESSVHSSGDGDSTACSTMSLNIDYKPDANCGFVDLDQCALALEKDGSIMSGLMGDDAPDGMINSDTLKDLISEISDLNPDFMREFDFDDTDKNGSGVSALTAAIHGGVPGAHADDSLSSSSPFTHCHNPSIAPVTPTTTTSPRLQTSNIKTEIESGAAMSTMDGPCVNGAPGRGLSHCSGHSPAAAATASPLATQLNAHHPSQTPPYCSGSSGLFDTSNLSSPSSSLQSSIQVPPSNINPPTNPSSFCPPTNSHPPGANHANNVHMGAINTKSAAHIPYTSPSSLAMDSPAAQTLKQMAEQHQHKAQQLNMNNYKSSSSPSPVRSPFSAGASGPSDSYPSFNNNEFGGAQSAPPTGNSANKFNNVPLRAQTGLPPHMDPMEMSIKHEHNMYTNSNCPPPYNGMGMDNPHAQQQQNVLGHSQQVVNNIKTLSQQQQHPPQPQMPVRNKNPPPGHLATANRMANPPAMGQPPPPMNSMLPANKSFTNVRPPNPGMSAGPIRNVLVPNSGYIPRLSNTPVSYPSSVRMPNNLQHPNYSSNGATPHNHSQPHVSQPVMSDANNATQQGVNPQMGMRLDFKPTEVSSAQHNFYYQQQPHGHVQSQAHLQSATETHSYSNADAGVRGGQTINFTQQHLRMANSTPPVNRPMDPGLAVRLNAGARMPNSTDPSRPHMDLVQQQRVRYQRAQSVSQQNQSIMSSNQMIPNHFSGPGRPQMGAQPNLLRPPANNLYTHHQQQFVNNPNNRLNYGPPHRGPNPMVAGASQPQQTTMGHQQHHPSMGQPQMSMNPSTAADWMTVQNQESIADNFHTGRPSLNTTFNSQGMGMQQQMSGHFSVSGYNHPQQQQQQQQQLYSHNQPQMCNSYQPQGRKTTMGSMESLGSGSMLGCGNSPHQQQLMGNGSGLSKMESSHPHLRQQDFNFDLLENIATDNESGATSSFNDDFFNTFDPSSGNSNSNYSNILDSL